MNTEFPFRIAISDERINALKQRLELTIFPDELEGAEHEYGASLVDIHRLIARCKDGYDWRKHEAALNNELPQFTRDINVEGFGTLNIHYVHKRNGVSNAIPLLFIHGWPGSFIEVRKILPLLVQASPNHPSFHVVALSLPGYGFSEAPTKKGFATKQYAEVGNKLMLHLGYNEYVTQGGDWGATVRPLITRRIAILYGGVHSKAWHTNFPVARPPTAVTRPLLYASDLLFGYSPAEKAGLKRTDWFMTQGRGYDQEQSTQPQTLGYGLTDSPVGLLAWIYEKLINWTDGYPWEDDEVLTWVSLYWFSRAGPAASLGIYYEIQNHEPNTFFEPIPTIVPTGHSYFPKEIICLPKRWLKTPNLIFEADHRSGGHFAAHERPEDLVGDLRKMFGKGGPAFGVVSGMNGYE